MSSIVPASVALGLKRLRHYVSPILLFSGVAALGYAGFQYGAMIFEQRHLQAIWRKQQITHRAFLQSAGEAALTRITIPSIQLSAVIVEGTDGLSLMVGPGHMIGTAEPGEPGNSVISAHRDTFFRKIIHLRPGDPILVEREGRSFTYEVEGFRIVEASDVSVAARADDNRLTLVTCEPAFHVGEAQQRLVVISKLVTPSATPSVAASKQPKSPVRAKREAQKSAGAAR